MVAAKALIRMADCYQKLGDGEARKTYERVLRDFSDQKEAVTIARSKLGSADSTRHAKGDRAVWTGRDVDLFGTVSPDGRFLTYVDWQGKTANLVLRDLEAGTNRFLTSSVSYDSGFAEWSAISRDGEQVAYSWTENRGSNQVRLASLKGHGVPTSRRVMQGEVNGHIRPFDWSPDARWLAVEVEREDRSSQIGLLAVQDGSLRVLKSVDWRGVGKMVFSPDGLYVAYDLATTDTGKHSQVFVMAIDGSRETAVVSDQTKNHVMGWSPDGYLVFASDRSGALALWAVPVQDGRRTAEPTLVKENLGSSWSLGLTPAGTLYVWKYASARYVRVAPIDLDGRSPLDASTSTFQRFIESRGRPDWSADGRYLVYIDCGPPGGGPCTLAVRSTDTGSVREVPHRLGYLGFPRLAPDGHAIVTEGRDLKGRNGIYLIDTQTGDITLIMPRAQTSPARLLDWSSDGKSIYLQRSIDSHVVITRRDLGSSQEMETFRTSLPGAGTLIISPDGRFVGTITTDTALVVVPIAGGAPRPLMRVTAPNVLDWRFQWTPDSQAVIVQKMSAAGGRGELWRVPLTGPARKLDVDTSHWFEGGHFQLHPDGRQIAFVAAAGESGAEVWALENFLPTHNVTK